MSSRAMLLAMLGALAVALGFATATVACEAGLYPDEVADLRPSLVVLGTVVSAPDSHDLEAGEKLVLRVEQVIYGQAQPRRLTVDNRLTEACGSTLARLDDGDRVVIAFDARVPNPQLNISSFWLIRAADIVELGSAYPPEPPTLEALRGAFADLPDTATIQLESVVRGPSMIAVLSLTLVAAAATAFAVGLGRRVRRRMG